MPNDEKLAAKVPEFDLILGGHDHSSRSVNIKNVFLCKSGTDFRELSNIDVLITRNEETFSQHSQAHVCDKDKGIIITHEKILVTKEFEPNKELEESIQEMYKEINKKKERSCGYLGVYLD
jgi:2',3'-cyclic-nucleotide 2'-phosphodiesterase (5'-nucleotidase family)